MEFECRRRSPRYPLAIDIEMTDVESANEVRGRTNTLSLYGCGVDAGRLFPKGTNLRIKLSHGGKDVNAVARVIYARSDLGMGLAFISFEREDEQTLEWWIAEFTSVPT